MNIHLDGALAWYDQGMSVIPILADGSKKPLVQWTEYMERRASREEVTAWFTDNPDRGVALVCGAVSGNLEMLEIESCRMGSDFLDRVLFEMRNEGCDAAWEYLLNESYCETTPSGGVHLMYRVLGNPVPGNTKIAMDETGKVTYAETRGERGYVIVAPSGGTVHATGDSWSVVAGQVGEVPSLDWDTRQSIHSALKRALDERKIPVYERPAGFEYDRQSSGDRPGDAFNDDQSVTIHDILVRNGWKYLGRPQGQDEYCHPLSSNMSTGSARTGHGGSPNLYAWSGMPQEGSYDKFAVLAHLEYGGDFSACSRALRALGYGAEPTVDDMSGWVTVADSQVRSAVEVEQSVEQPREPVLGGFDDTHAARWAAHYLNGSFKYVYEYKAFTVYSDGVWVRDKTAVVNQAMEIVVGKVAKRAEAFLQSVKDAQGDKDEMAGAKLCVSYARSAHSARGINALKERFGQQKTIATTSDMFDPNPDLVCVQNGVLDLSTGELVDHDPKFLLTKRIATTYDPDAVAPRWLQYLEEVLPDPDVREYIQVAAGMTLLGRMEEAAFFLLHGDTGCGKSQFLKVMGAVMGDYAATATAAAFRTTRGGGEKATNDLHALMGARFVSTSETSEGTILDEELIKRITGGDPITTRAMYEDNVTWRPRFTMWMASNFPPRMNSDDNAIWRRVKPIHFPMQFVNTGNEEKGLAERMIAAELPGILNWLLEGVQRYLKQGLIQPEIISKAVTSYRAEADQVVVFLTEARAEETLAFDEELWIKATQLYNIYVEWSKSNNVPPLGQNRFGRRLTNLGYVSRKSNSQVVRSGLGIPAGGWQTGRQY